MRELSESEGAPPQVIQALLDFISDIPSTSELTSSDPQVRAREIARSASLKAGATSASFALPPGPLGMVTVIPDLIMIWKIQAQMVADIAGAFGKSSMLSREQMLYCLFRHTAAQAVKGLVMRVGERLLIRRASLRFLQNVAKSVGLRITQRAIGTAVSRWIPLVGALGVGGYAYYDTSNVADTAIDLFSEEVSADAGPELDVHA